MKARDACRNACFSGVPIIALKMNMLFFFYDDDDDDELKDYNFRAYVGADNSLE